MQREEIEGAVTFILRDLVEDDAFVADTTMTAADLPGWDSFTQVEFVAALESRFDIRLPLAEVETWQTLEDALTTVERHVHTPGESPVS